MIARTLPDGPALRVTRLVTGLSQEVAAVRAKIPLGRFRRIEVGRDLPTPEEIASILGALSSAGAEDLRSKGSPRGTTWRG